MVNIYRMKRLIKLREIWNKNIFVGNKIVTKQRHHPNDGYVFLSLINSSYFLYVCVVLLLSLEMEVCSAWEEIKPARDTFADNKAKIPATQDGNEQN